ncbi:RNA polymerase sigma factor SigZ [Microbulbifer sp. VTAC004]|uniref:RNA polymerase sigma factor SigZ n=1 Tax=Microbulbifer sp. VTAC004 TaxID=3243386 RepID=UPI004039B704
MTIDSIWKKYSAALKAFLHSRISSPDMVDDILQEILIRTHKNIHTIRDQKSIKSWLFQVANHAVIDFYRKKGRVKEVTLDDSFTIEEDTNTQQSLSACIEPFIKGLPPQSAELLIAIELNGQSQKTYSEEHGIPYSTVKSRVQKSRRELRSLFEDCCHLTLDSHGAVIDYVPKSNKYRNC